MKTKDLDRIRIRVALAPPSANMIWRQGAGRMYLTPAARRFFRAVAAAAWGLFVPESWVGVDVAIFVRPPRRVGDVDNYIKPTLDALTRAGVWPDDKIVSADSCARLDPATGAPSVYIEITKSRDGLYKSAAPW